MTSSALTRIDCRPLTDDAGLYALDYALNYATDYALDYAPNYAVDGRANLATNLAMPGPTSTTVNSRRV